jgi:chitin disaccharide deacetylase
MRVIFNGDDFGLTSGVNHGIISAFKHGLLRSASLMAVGEATQEAMGLALENPGLDVGLHLVLAEEAPLRPPATLSTLVGHDGLLPSRNRILRDIFFRKLDYGQVEAECCAQVEKVLEAGIHISHLDSHQYIHLFPGIFKVCLKIARRYHIPFMRGAMLEPLLAGALTAPGVGPLRLAQWACLGTWTRLMAARGCFSQFPTVFSAGFLNAGGRMDCATLLTILDKLAARQSCDRVEFILHPGSGDRHTRHKYRHWHYFWENDLKLLLDSDLHKGLKMRNIKATSFGKES